MKQPVKVQTRKGKHREKVEEPRREEDKLRSLEDAQIRRWDEIQIQKDKHRKEADEVGRLKDEFRIEKVKLKPSVNLTISSKRELIYVEKTEETMVLRVSGIYLNCFWLFLQHIRYT